MRKLLTFFLISVALLGCNGGGSDEPNSAPTIVNLQVTPEVVCVDDKATITFTVLDSNDDQIVWAAGLSSGIHGGVDPAIGTVPSGTTITTTFDAAKSGRHDHTVKLTVIATDITGLKAQPAEKEFFVFNCS